MLHCFATSLLYTPHFSDKLLIDSVMSMPNDEKCCNATNWYVRLSLGLPFSSPIRAQDVGEAHDGMFE